MTRKRETRTARPGGATKGDGRHRWPRDVRLAAARAVVDQGLSAHSVAPRFGVPYTTLLEWSRKYRAGGEARLVPAGDRGAAQPSVASASRRSAIVAAKRVDSGEQILGSIPYGDFELPNQLWYEPKTLEFSPQAYACP